MKKKTKKKAPNHHGGIAGDPGIWARQQLDRPILSDAEKAAQKAEERRQFYRDNDWLDLTGIPRPPRSEFFTFPYEKPGRGYWG